MNAGLHASHQSVFSAGNLLASSTPETSQRQRASRVSRRQFCQQLGTMSSAGLASLVSAGCGTPRTRLSAPRWQIGCYTRPWDQFELPVALDGVAQAGFRYVGIMTAKGKSWVIITPATPPGEAARVGDEARRRGLSVLSVYGDFRAEATLAEAIVELRRLIANCAACGSPDLLLGGTDKEALYTTYCRAIAECCDFAQSQRVRLSIKPHGGLNATGPQCRQALARVNHPNFGLWYDPGNIFYYSNGELNPVADAATVDGLVVGMSVKDYRHPKEVLVTPGTGQVDFPRVMDRLRRGGFQRGPLIVECLARGDLKQLATEAVQARRFLETLLSQAA
jgi:sugar phosphate isomerase/epimerase